MLVLLKLTAYEERVLCRNVDVKLSDGVNRQRDAEYLFPPGIPCLLNQMGRRNVHLDALLIQDRAGIPANHIAKLPYGALTHFVEFRYRISAHHARYHPESDGFRKPEQNILVQGTDNTDFEPYIMVEIVDLLNA